MKISENNSYSTEDFIKLSIDIHGNKFDYSKVNYVASQEYVEIICSIHGSFWQYPAGHLQGKGCFDCYHDSTATFPMHSLEEFVQKAVEVHCDKYDYANSIFNSLSAKINIHCPKHGIFLQEASAHIRGSGCWRCSISTTSKKEQHWLDIWGIPQNNRQFPITIGKKSIRVDGYDSRTNTVYEFNGDFWHGNPDVFDHDDINPKNKRTYGELYKKTLKKAKMLKKAGFNLVEIWEHDFDVLMKERDLKDDH